MNKQNETRIQPQEILEIFQELHLQPIAGSFRHQIGDQHCACGIGAYFKKNQSEYAGGISSLLDQIQALNGQSYNGGYFDGFDGEKKVERVRKDVEGYNNGYEDGKAARELLIANGFTFAGTGE